MVLITWAWAVERLRECIQLSIKLQFDVSTLHHVQWYTVRFACKGGILETVQGLQTTPSAHAEWISGTWHQATKAGVSDLIGGSELGPVGNDQTGLTNRTTARIPSRDGTREL